MGDTMGALAKHVVTTEAENKIFLENASSASWSFALPKVQSMQAKEPPSESQ